MKISFLTIGCKVNFYDSSAMAELLAHEGYEIVEQVSLADIAIVNTCAVTAEAQRKSRQALRRIRREYPRIKLIGAGCALQHGALQDIEMDAYIGTSNRADIVQGVRAALAGDVWEPTDMPEKLAYEELPAPMEQGRTRAHLKIQDGCDAFCTYCIIAHLRGAPRSRPLENIRAEAQRFVAAGYREIVLVGINLSRYGCDLPGEVSLGDALEAACVPQARIRLGSLEAEGLDEALLQRLAGNAQVCPHLHVSLQSGSDSVLKRMGRRYTAQRFAQRMAFARSIWPDVAFTTDVIVGFPGESVQEHQESLDFVRDMRFAKVHVFRYSPREGTPAATMPDQVPKALAIERAAQMSAVSDALQAQFYQGLVGSVQPVLFESPVRAQRGWMEGYTPNYARVLARVDDARGKIIPVRIEQVGAEHVIGSVIEN